jgi:hypothetical protein
MILHTLPFKLSLMYKSHQVLRQYPLALLLNQCDSDRIALGKTVGKNFPGPEGFPSLKGTKATKYPACG